MSTRKKPINGRNKGSGYERKIAKDLGEWWGEEFHRTPASGGLHWQKDNRVAGDIVTPPDSVFPFTIECKKREGFDLEQLLKGTGDIEDWWEQAVGDSERVESKPLLIFSKNRAPDYTMMRMEDFAEIMSVCLERSGGRTDFDYYMIHKSRNGNRVIFFLSDLIKWVRKEDVLKAFNL
jgi:hypothetical protein